MATVLAESLVLKGDEELIRDGSLLARAELWRRWQPWLERRAAQYYRDTPGGRDCFVGEVLDRTWTEFLEAPMAADSVPRCKALLKTMVRYNALDCLRARRRFVDAALPERPAVARSPFDDMVLSRVRRDVRDALRTLPPRQARVLGLRYWEGMSSAEIAATEGISIANVDQIASRARRALAPVLGNWRDAAGPAMSAGAGSCRLHG